MLTRIDRIFLPIHATVFTSNANSAMSTMCLLYFSLTSQIRAQLAAVGCPLLGDTLYSPMAILNNDVTSLLDASSESTSERASCHSNNKRMKASQVADNSAPESTRPVASRNVNLLPDGSRRLAEPDGGIGLQAYMLTVRMMPTIMIMHW